MSFSRNLVPASALLFLVACGSMKSVPVEALAEVSTASVVHLASLEEGILDRQQSLTKVQRRRDEVSRNADAANSAVFSATSDLESAKRSRGMAVCEGDVETAGALGEDVDAASATVERRSARASEQNVLLALLEQGVLVRSAELDAALAGLELARALAAVDGGADLKLQKCQRQSDKYDKELSHEVSVLNDLEASHETTLDDFPPPAARAPQP